MEDTASSTKVLMRCSAQRVAGPARSHLWLKRSEQEKNNGTGETLTYMVPYLHFFKDMPMVDMDFVPR